MFRVADALLLGVEIVAAGFLLATVAAVVYSLAESAFEATR